MAITGEKTRPNKPHVDSGIIAGRPHEPVVWTIFRTHLPHRTVPTSMERSQALTGLRRTEHIRALRELPKRPRKKICFLF